MPEEKNYDGMSQEDMLKTLQERDAHIGRLNAESADRRKKLEAFEKEENERQQAALSEAEKLTKERDVAKAELEGLRSELYAERVKAAITKKATELGFADPADAYALLDLSLVEEKENGQIAGFEKSLEALAESKPYLLGDGKTPGLGTPKRGQPVQKPRPEDEVPVTIRF